MKARFGNASAKVCHGESSLLIKSILKTYNKNILRAFKAKGRRKALTALFVYWSLFSATEPTQISLAIRASVMHVHAIVYAARNKTASTETSESQLVRETEASKRKYQCTYPTAAMIMPDTIAMIPGLVKVVVVISTPQLGQDMRVELGPNGITVVIIL